MIKRKKLSKHQPKIIQVIESSTIPDLDKKIAINYISNIAKSDARRTYCHFNETANNLVDCFRWELIYPGFEYWSNLNEQLMDNLKNY